MGLKARGTDPLIAKIVEELRSKYKCHTVILYGSRARGDFTPESDYDILGVRTSGRKLRVARKEFGVYLDIFVYPAKEFVRAGEQHLHFREGRVLVEKRQFGTRLLKRLKSAHKQPPKFLPDDEIAARRVWANKMLERARRGDNEGNYRRTWLTMALLEDYFLIRKRRFEGSKAALRWLAEHDHSTFRLYARLLRSPKNLQLLEKMVKRAAATR